MGEATRFRFGSIFLVGLGYAVVGVLTGELAKSAASPGQGKAWRLAAWLLSLVLFLGQFCYERFKIRATTRETALHAALAVAWGAFLLAAVGPVRAHWGEPHFLKTTLLSLALWPVLLGVPAFLVGLVAGAVLDRSKVR